MKVDWKIDPEILALAWKRLNKTPGAVSKKLDKVERVLDIGGGSGWFGLMAKSHHPDARVFSADLTPRVKDNGVEHIKGSGLDIPFKDSTMDVVTVHAMLHHVPDELDKALAEIKRVLRPGGLVVIQEPLGRNPISRLAGSLVTTAYHDPGERPLDPELLRKAVASSLKIQLDERFFLTSYLCPHIIPRLPESLKGLGRAVSRNFIRLDNKMLASMPGLRNKASYISIVAKRS